MKWFKWLIPNPNHLRDDSLESRLVYGFIIVVVLICAAALIFLVPWHFWLVMIAMFGLCYLVGSLGVLMVPSDRKDER